MPTFVKRLVTPVKATSLSEMASGFPAVSGFTESCQLELHNDCEWCLLPLYNVQPCFRELTRVELENARVQILGVSSPTTALPLLLLNPFLCSLGWSLLESCSFSLILPQPALPLLRPSHAPNPQVVLPLWNLWSDLISNKQPLLLLSLWQADLSWCDDLWDA